MNTPVTLLEAMGTIGCQRINELSEEAADLGVEYEERVALVAERVTEDLDAMLVALLTELFATPVNRSKPVRGSALLERAHKALAPPVEEL